MTVNAERIADATFISVPFHIMHIFAIFELLFSAKCIVKKKTTLLLSFIQQVTTELTDLHTHLLSIVLVEGPEHFDASYNTNVDKLAVAPILNSVFCNGATQFIR